MEEEEEGCEWNTMGRQMVRCENGPDREEVGLEMQHT